MKQNHKLLLFVSLVLTIFAYKHIKKIEPLPEPTIGEPCIIYEQISVSNERLNQVLDDGELSYVIVDPILGYVQVYSLDGEYLCTYSFYSHPNGIFRFAVKNGLFYVCDKERNLYVFENAKFLEFVNKRESNDLVGDLNFESQSEIMVIRNKSVWRIDGDKEICIQEYEAVKFPFDTILFFLSVFAVLVIFSNTIVHLRKRRTGHGDVS